MKDELEAMIILGKLRWIKEQKKDFVLIYDRNLEDWTLMYKFNLNGELESELSVTQDSLLDVLQKSYFAINNLKYTNI